MDLKEIMSFIGAASIISAIVTCIIDMIKTRKDMRFEKLFLEKEQRYRSMLIFMSILIDVENYKHIDTTYKQKNIGQAEIKGFYEKEVKLHSSFFYLFAADSVINAIDKFINEPSDVNYKEVAIEMRKDLWKKRKSIRIH